MGLDQRQRRAELMARIGRESPQGMNGRAETQNKIIDRVDQPAHLSGDTVFDRSDIIRAAPGNRAFQPVQRSQGAFDGKPLRLYNVGPDATLTNFSATRFVLEPSEFARLG